MASLPPMQESLQPLEFDTPILEAKIAVLPPKREWRVKVPGEAKLTVKILYGIAEVFGTELTNDVEYTFQSANIAIYSVEHVKIEWKCAEALEPTISSETSMPYIYYLHFALEKMRLSSFDGPRMLIVGESSSGKTTLAKTLSAYALKGKPYTPLYINLNPQEGIFAPPSCITATPISYLLEVESTMWGQSMTTGATALHSKQPMVKSFGLEQIAENRELYLEAMNQLSKAVEGRLRNDPLVRRSGIIVDTPPLSHLDDSYTELKAAISKFNIDIMVVCCPDDSLAIKLGEVFQSLVRIIIRIPTSPGVVKIDDVARRSFQRSQIREYFYGNKNTVLSPYTIGVDLMDVVVWKPKSTLELGDAGAKTSMTELERVEVNASNLQHAIVSITYAPRKSTPEEVLKSGVLGIALVTEVNETKRKMRILLPVPGRLPDKAMILTAYRYLE
ncbi:HEL132Cp [Eremothecium sinecaudum]|uniref:Polynucleotide 5'-hydroxyl-kinase GRC3 n=1 Tax=Eremothecium sinecaudum TaxID=45286 RepID=A0A109UZ90_9SACH|nr:HEL132Cp [Eremothecium sinecaudum]AMD21148.1 HEL132Cp [Eremothecium sinecaudum]